jgi:hypothetical protein
MCVIVTKPVREALFSDVRGTVVYCCVAFPRYSSIVNFEVFVQPIVVPYLKTCSVVSSLI